MNKITIRIAKEKDAKEIVEVNNKTWETTYGHLMNKKVLDERMKETENRIKRWAQIIKEQKSFYVAQVNNNIIGFTSYGPSKNPKYENAGEVYSLYVLKEYQGQGIGKMLFNKAFELLKKSGYNDVIINCLETNPSVDFYVKMGGKPVEKIKQEMYGKFLIETVLLYENILNK